jgi:hypothetical protein
VNLFMGLFLWVFWVFFFFCLHPFMLDSSHPTLIPDNHTQGLFSQNPQSPTLCLAHEVFGKALSRQESELLVQGSPLLPGNPAETSPCFPTQGLLEKAVG